MQAQRSGRHCLTASSMNAAGNIPSLRSDTNSAGRRHEFVCGTHAPAASARPDCRDFWLEAPCIMFTLIIVTVRGRDDSIAFSSFSLC